MRAKTGSVVFWSSASLLAAAGAAAQPTCIGYSRCPEVNYLTLLQNSQAARHVQTEDSRFEAEALQRFRDGVTGDAALRTLGKLVIYDANLSVNRNVPCAACHSPQAGFTGAIPALNRQNVAFLGSTQERTSKRKPMSYAYSPFAPVLHYDSQKKSFVGGNFWDMRATGLVTGNPAADQALDPPLTATEMDNHDPACIVLRIAAGPYRDLFTQVWGTHSLAIDWPANAQRRCSIPLSSNNQNPTILDLSAADRARATAAYYDMAKSAAAYEAGPDVSAFSSKFDRWQEGQATLTAQEMEGYRLFTGQANCSQCHSAAGKHPLFTDYSAANLGIPRNPDLPFLYENRRDVYGYIANPTGPAYVDNGVGTFLGSAQDTNPEWHKLAPQFIGTFQVATARNTDLRPSPGFDKAYMHNGYFKTLQQVVHFYNTRDVLPRCPGDPEIGQNGAGTACWPAPAQAANLNTTQLGNLGLSSSQEAAIVAFLGTLSDAGAAP